MGSVPPKWTYEQRGLKSRFVVPWPRADLLRLQGDLGLRPANVKPVPASSSASREETMKTLIATGAMAIGIVANVATAGPLPEARPDDVGFSQQGLTRLDQFFAREIAAKRVPGAVVAIARDGKLVHYKAYGQ